MFLGLRFVELGVGKIIEFGKDVLGFWLICVLLCCFILVWVLVNIIKVKVVCERVSSKVGVLCFIEYLVIEFWKKNRRGR